MMSLSILFFFFKQETAYEMRISDWSSDVCSSDLHQSGHDRIDEAQRDRQPHIGTEPQGAGIDQHRGAEIDDVVQQPVIALEQLSGNSGAQDKEAWRIPLILGLQHEDRRNKAPEPRALQEAFEIGRAHV